MNILIAILFLRIIAGQNLHAASGATDGQSCAESNFSCYSFFSNREEPIVAFREEVDGALRFGLFTAEAPVVMINNPENTTQAPLNILQQAEAATVGILQEIQNTDFISQEAITHLKHQIKENFAKMLYEEPSAQRISQYMPGLDTLTPDFAEFFTDLVKIYTIKIDRKKTDPVERFKFKNARRALHLLNAEQIEHHPSSNIQSYSVYYYPGFPNIRQLFILAYKLRKINIQNFVESYIALECDTPEKWRLWKEPFATKSKFRDILALEDWGLCLSIDRSKGSPFVNSIVEFLIHGETLPAKGTRDIMKAFLDKYVDHSADEITPLTEALFMIMRGHNVRIFDKEEENSPACAEGAYLNIIRALEEILPGERSYVPITLENCG